MQHYDYMAEFVEFEKEKADKAEVIFGVISMLEAEHRIWCGAVCFEDYSTICDLLHELAYEYFELTGEPYVPTLPPPPPYVPACPAVHGLFFAEPLAA
ncbi:MAG: hypothetical protein WCW77_04255 [Patescibacteria group bacterium]|jgi:hypothetical protein